MVAPSATLPGPAIEIVAFTVVSLIVPVPIAVGLAVVPDVTVAVSVKSSPESAGTSSITSVRTWIDVVPASIVADVASVQVAPTNTWVLSGPAEP